jgi:hypothetical protein
MLSHLRSPVAHIKRLPNWSWTVWIWTVVVSTQVLGALTVFGAFRFSPFRFSALAVFSGIFISPLSTLFVTMILGAFFHYSVFFVFGKGFDLKKSATLVFMASVPWLIVSPVADDLPLLSPIAALLSGLLAYVGLVENSPLNRKQSAQLVGSVLFVFFVFWVSHLFSVMEFRNKYEVEIPKESLRILEKEMGEKEMGD